MFCIWYLDTDAGKCCELDLSFYPIRPRKKTKQETLYAYARAVGDNNAGKAAGGAFPWCTYSDSKKLVRENTATLTVVLYPTKLSISLTFPYSARCVCFHRTNVVSVPLPTAACTAARAGCAPTKILRLPTLFLRLVLRRPLPPGRCLFYVCVFIGAYPGIYVEA